MTQRARDVRSTPTHARMEGPSKHNDILDIPKDWNVVRFAEAASIAEGQVDPRRAPYVSMVHVGPDNIEPGTGRLLHCRTAHDLGLISGKYLFRAGDVVYSKIRPYLRKSVLVGFSGLCSADMYPLTTRDGFDVRYIHYVTLSDPFTQQAISHQERTGIPKLNREQLNRILVLKPPLSEQRAIGAVLQRLQAALEVHDTIVTGLRELKAATMGKLFREGLRGEPLKQTEIGEIPASWQVVRLGEYCEPPRYGHTETASRDPVGPKFLRITDIQEHGVDWASVPYCRCPEHVLTELRLRAGDLVFARIGATTGKSYLITSCPEAVFASYLIRLRAKPGLDPSYLSCFFEADAYWLQIRANRGMNVKGGLNASVLKGLLVPLPYFDEQKEIAGIIKALDQSALAATRQRNSLQKLFCSLLHLLMTGHVRVPPGLVPESLPARPGGKLAPEVIDEIVRRIVEAVAPEKIILFGSAAREEMGPDSDLDLLVVKRCDNRREVARAVRACLRGVSPGRGKDVVVVTPEDVARDRDTIGYIIRPALREGRVLYAS